MAEAQLSRIVFYRHFAGAVDQAASHDAVIEVAHGALVDGFTAVMTGQLEQAMAAGRVADGHAGELARALNLMNIHYLLETLGRDPGFDRQLARDTLLAIWAPLTSHAS